MHVYLRWYENDQPQGAPKRMENEHAARAAVLERYPTATFGQRVSTRDQPTAAMVVGIDQVLFAYPGRQAPGIPPVADILFPAP